MNNPAEQIIAANKANMDAFEGAAKKAYAGVEKLVELNMAASKAALGESFNHAKAVMSVKTPQEFMSLQAAFFQPLAEKSTAYFQHVQSIATEGSDKKTLVVTPVAPLAPGSYQVQWHALSVDTHKSKGSYGFKISE